MWSGWTRLAGEIRLNPYSIVSSDLLATPICRGLRAAIAEPAPLLGFILEIYS